MYSVYTLSDPRTQTVRYVGLGKNPYRRYAGHLINSGSTNSKKREWIEELLELNMAPTMTVLETVETREEAERKETYWMQYYLKLTGPLFNISKNRSLKPMPEKTGTMEDQLRQLLKDHGWNLFSRTVSNRQYFYAQKWRKGEIYIGPVAKIDRVTEDQVLEKLAKIK